MNRNPATGKHLTTKQLKEVDKLCRELPMLQDRLARLGMVKTAAAVNLAVQKIGYEAAEKRAHL